MIIYFANCELAKNFLNLGALCFLNKMHLGISRKNVPSNRENGEKHFPVFTLVFKFVFKLGQSLEITLKKKKIRTFKSKPEFIRILEQLFFPAFYETSCFVFKCYPKVNVFKLTTLPLASCRRNH